MTDQGPEQPGDFEQPTPAPPPQPVPAPAASGMGAPADLGTRFLARLIDHILLGIVTFVIVIPLVIAAAFADVSTGFGGFFGGFGVEETAEALGVSPATVKRQWTFAKAWLLRALRGSRP